jgi:diguanylate cyclase (GGDEF)-like protein
MTIDFLILSMLPLEAFSMLFQTAIVTVVAFALLAGLTSYLRYENLARHASGGGDSEMSAEDAFMIQVAHFLGSGRRNPEPFSVGILFLSDHEQNVERYGEEAVSLMLDFLHDQLSKNLRSTDTVLRLGEDRMGIAVKLGLDQAESGLNRIFSHALRDSFREQGTILELDIRVGIATFPETTGGVPGLVREATERAEEAVANQKRLVLPEKTNESSEEQDEATESEAEARKLEEEKLLARQHHLLDPLTGVLKPEEIGSAMTKYIARYRKDDKPVSLINLDVDSLERYNNHYGDSAGDAILKTLGQILQDSLREEDLIGRIEGGEFVICMGSTAEEALAAAERLALEIKSFQILYGSSNLRITVCMGISNFPKFGEVARNLYDQAEIALRSAKQRGKNQCALFSPTMIAPRRADGKANIF